MYFKKILLTECFDTLDIFDRYRLVFLPHWKQNTFLPNGIPEIQSSKHKYHEDFVNSFLSDNKLKNIQENFPHITYNSIREILLGSCMSIHIAPCGSGKSHFAINFINSIIQGKNKFIFDDDITY